MKYNFDETIDRRNTNSLKFDFAVERGMPEDVLPLWVADMDFRVAPSITAALEASVRHGIYGYSEPQPPYFDALEGWFLRRFGWKPQPDWLVKTPGVVYAVAAAIRSLTQPGDPVLIQQPVYYPFAQTIMANGRRPVNNALVLENGVYQIDFVDFEAKIIEHGVRLFILCSPHNPVGRVWNREELETLGDICLKHQVTVVSDEIHGDFVYPGYRHLVFPSVKPAYLENTILCTSPSKTFNIAGLQVSNIFIANEAIRKAFTKEILRSGYSELNTLGLVACQAAYAAGEDWLEQLLSYLGENLAFLRRFLKEKLPQITLVEPQGTYLAWLDCRGLGLTAEALDDLVIHQAKLWLDSGIIFGPDGAGFQRVNIACPRSVLEKALLQLASAVEQCIQK